MEWVGVEQMKWLGYGSEYASNEWSQIVDCWFNESIRYVNWVFSDSWLSMCIGINQGWKTHVMGVTLTRIRGFSYVTWQFFAILPINAMEAKWVIFQYPILFELYKHFFNAPASSAAVERSFSIQNAIVIPRRSQLNPNLIKQLLFINMNVKSANDYGWREEMMKYLNTNANK